MENWLMQLSSHHASIKMRHTPAKRLMRNAGGESVGTEINFQKAKLMNNANIELGQTTLGNE
jgi:hypothetical protein